MPKIFSGAMSLDIDSIKFDPIPLELFDKTAQMAAKIIGDNRDSNKPTQVRKFYDELCMWHDKVHMAKDKEKMLQDNLPFVRMMNAKIAYAKGRNQKEDKRDPSVADRTGLVDKNFVDLFGPCIRQVDSYKTLRNFKLFFEAFMGFYKVERPKD